MYKVCIKNNETGECRTRTYDEWDEYAWTEGNFGCDCNRHLEFERANGETNFVIHECGETKYSVKLVEIDGKSITNT